MRMMAEFGSATLAGYAISIRVKLFTLMPSWGMSNAAALVGQNLGAGKPERPEISVWKAGKYNAYFMGLVSNVYLFFSYDLVGWFNVNAVVIENGGVCLQIIEDG